MIVTADMIRQQFNLDPKERDLVFQDRTPIQFSLGDDIDSFVEKYSPVEIHMSVTHFFESTFKVVFIDLDASPSMGIATVFDYACGLKDFIMGISPTKDIRMVYSGNRGFHLHVTLSQRLFPEEVEKFLEKVASYPKPFIGKIDSAVNSIHHFIRVPYSYNCKGKKFSFYVDKLKDFNEDLAVEWSSRLYYGAIKGD